MDLQTIEQALTEHTSAIDTIGSKEEHESLEKALRALGGALAKHRTQNLEMLEAAQTKLDGMTRWWRPLNEAAREERSRTEALSQKLDHIRFLESKVATTIEALHQREAQKGAHTLAWRAEKLQAGIEGSWEMKASITAAALMLDTEDEASLDYARTAIEAMAFKVEDEGTLIAAAMLSERPAKEAIARARAIKDEISNIKTAALSAGVLSTSSPLQLSDIARALKKRSTLEISAGFLSDLPVEKLKAQADRLEPDLPGDTKAKAQIIAASFLAGLDAKETLKITAQITPRLRGSRETDGPLTAAALLTSARSTSAQAPPIEAMLQRLERTSAKTFGSPEAETPLMAAAILSSEGLERSFAMIAQLQRRLSGGWGGEAMIIGAGLLSGAQSTRMTKAAYILPGLFIPRR